MAAWILAEANAQATEIRHEARDEAAASLADAKKEAADLLRQASDRAAAKLAAVESEAAQVQAALMRLSTELSEVAANTLHPAADSTAAGAPGSRIIRRGCRVGVAPSE